MPPEPPTAASAIAIHGPIAIQAIQTWMSEDLALTVSAANFQACILWRCWPTLRDGQ